MDRLTIRKRNIVRIIGAGDDNQDSGELLRRCIKKLADYEDSGNHPRAERQMECGNRHL